MGCHPLEYPENTLAREFGQFGGISKPFCRGASRVPEEYHGETVKPGW